MKFSNEIIAKAKEAKTSEELIDLAKENNIDLTEEEAKRYYAQLHPTMGELSDDELDNVAGGGCYSEDGRLETTCGHKCKHYVEGRKSGVKGTCFRCKYWGVDPNAVKAGLWDMVLDVIMEAAQTRECFHPANRKGH